MSKENEKLLKGLLIGLVIAFLVAWLRRNADSLSFIPGLPQAINFFTPELPEAGNLTVNTHAPRDFQAIGSDGMNYPSANTCGCGTSNANTFVSTPPPVVQQAALRLVPPSPVPFRPAPCFEQIDFRAATAPGTSLYGNLSRNLRSKHFKELQRAGYEQSVYGWVRYVWDNPSGYDGRANRHDQKQSIAQQTRNYVRCL